MRLITSEVPGRCVKKWSFHCQTLRLSDSLASGTYTSSSVDQSSRSCRQPHAPVVTWTTPWQSSLIPVYVFVFHNTETFHPPLLPFTLSVIINQKSFLHSSIHTPDITVNLSSCQTVSFDLDPLRWRECITPVHYRVFYLRHFPTLRKKFQETNNKIQLEGTRGLDSADLSQNSRRFKWCVEVHFP
jgi:hypothetical protein